MPGLKVYQKPRGFVLPDAYARRHIGDSRTDFSYCRRAEIDQPGFDVYEIGVYYLLDRTVPVPGPRGIAMEQHQESWSRRYYVYVPRTGGVIFCIGSNLHLLHNPLEAHSGSAIFDRVIDLDQLNAARMRGVLRVIGQTCKNERRTQRVARRRLNGQPYRPSDRAFEHGPDVEDECYEILVEATNGDKAFRVYPSGLITTHRLPDSANEFEEMQRVYNLINSLLS